MFVCVEDGGGGGGGGRGGQHIPAGLPYPPTQDFGAVTEYR